MKTTIPSKKTARKLRVAEAVNYLITVQITENNAFWQRDVQEILAELNEDIPEALTTFQGNTALGNALNATISVLNVRDENGNEIFPIRAPVESGRSDIVFDGTAFVYVPPEPGPEPVLIIS